MFTGIIEEIGEIKSVKKGAKSATLTIQGSVVTKDSNIGDSIAVNGVCLTATTISGNTFTADVMAETMRRSSLGELSTGSKVNLERAMAANSRFGGHIVSGHIDGCGTIRSFVREDNAVWVTIDAPSAILKYIIEKGSIAIDGISLTVAYVDEACFKVSIIPHTAGETTLLMKKPGDTVNLENDVIGKYVEKLLGLSSGSPATVAGASETSLSHTRNARHGQAGKSNIDADFLMKNGFM
ncbi:MAG: riboflavin synthase [Lachnospiraceae bacterium]|nr:riboflavin synthase [Lachnospiraceae bacterium]